MENIQKGTLSQKKIEETLDSVRKYGETHSTKDFVQLIELSVINITQSNKLPTHRKNRLQFLYEKIKITHLKKNEKHTECGCFNCTDISENIEKILNIFSEYMKSVEKEVNEKI